MQLAADVVRLSYLLGLVSTSSIGRPCTAATLISACCRVIHGRGGVCTGQTTDKTLSCYWMHACLFDPAVI